ncbi:MAG: amidohydrolase family protein [Spirochaetota bacterium]
MGILFINGIFHSMEKEREVFSGLLMEDGIIKEVFNRIPEAGIHTVFDCRGSCVFPGFIDTHTHSFEGGLYSLGADLSEINSLPELFEVLSVSKRLGDKIIAWRFNEENIKEKRFPTIDELDKIFPETPVLIRRVDGHSCIANSAALKKIHWVKKPDISLSAAFARDQNKAITRWFHSNLEEETILKAYAAAAENAIKGGCTTVHVMIGDGKSDPLHFSLLREHLKDFPVEFILYPQVANVEVAAGLDSPRLGGCLLVDGSFGSHTAALLKPYTDRPEIRGQLYNSNAYWESLVSQAHAAGLQCAVHAIGDAAIRQITEVYHSVQQKHSKDLRHMIIHCELLSDTLLFEGVLNKILDSGTALVIQPMFDRLWGGSSGFYSKVMGEERALHTNRLQSIREKNILLTGSSDWYVTELNPLKGIHAAVHLHNPKERLTPFQALELYTSKAALLSFDEGRLGKLLPGFQADMVCLSENPLPATNIDTIKINYLFKKGKLIRDNFPFH